ncbi:threonyl-tRNA synthetase [Magnaporthiopsis poae ATCC 64411]|uniref:threonine--tRNA ligase n=1 Tax=Magnaporthiopsis poae (strain ATCC 64411 / 73-15) TaxID=644358 RepID=A0A0C4DUE2_MAGP6|nr:threonyl-tRNA synthetase [Magnaporthiopsis poae ATCC 64411]
MEPAKDAVDALAQGVKKVVVGAGEPKEGKKGGAKKEKKGAAAAADSGPLELNPPPSFLQDRVELFDRLKKEYDAEIAQKPRDPITITMPDGSVKPGVAWETTPADIAKGISTSLFKRTVVARLDGDKEQLWDLERPLERSCKLELLDFSDPQGQFVFWHSSAHILGEAAERRFGCSLCIGPPVDNGFYYEMALPDGGAVQATDWKPLETIVSKIVKEKQKFERLLLSKEDLLEMFKYNKYKQHIIKDKIPDGTKTTVYRNGPLIDLCRGPHVPDTGRIEAFAIMKNSASYFLGDKDNDSLQRIYGVSFPSKKELTEYKKFLEEAAKRDHRLIGKQQELFFFHDYSPGSAMWLPHGTRIYNTLLAFIREIYWDKNYEEVITPNIYNADLWKQSGHWQFYKDDMFVIEQDKETFGLKPMNCPGHALMFAHRERSHRELPWRVADFGVLHRNEASGALSGLTRVRRFQQDDAHIFCREDQIKDEILDLFDFLRKMYSVMGLTFKLRLSTRPEKYMGALDTWNKAEDSLRDALDIFSKSEGGVPWELNEGDGAFYGPKIDIAIMDCLNREWQCATIQLDFVQPQNFGLEYMAGEDTAETKAKADEAKSAAPQAPKFKVKDPQAIIDSANATTEAVEAALAGAEAESKKEKVIKKLTPGCARPVMIHRAMAGSIERFTGILCEHFAGKWPMWLSPRQILVVPVGKGFYDYAEEVRAIFKKAKMHIDVDTSGNTLQKKIRTGQLAQYNFIFVVGAEEMNGRQVNVRNRDDPATQDRGQPISLDVAIEKLTKLRDERGTYNPFPAPAKSEAPKAAAS